MIWSDKISVCLSNALQDSVNHQEVIYRFGLAYGVSTDQWFSPGTLVSSTNKTDRHDITEILLKMVLNTINLLKSTSANSLNVLLPTL
jgi:uncharacterized membrane protein YjjP (DUF1212 family)